MTLFPKYSAFTPSAEGSAALKFKFCLEGDKQIPWEVLAAASVAHYAQPGCTTLVGQWDEV